MSRVDGVETEMYFIPILKKKRETGTQNSNDDRESARTYLHQLILSFVRQQFAPHLEEVPSRERERERERDRQRRQWWRSCCCCCWTDGAFSLFQIFGLMSAGDGEESSLNTFVAPLHRSQSRLRRFSIFITRRTFIGLFHCQIFSIFLRHDASSAGSEEVHPEDEDPVEGDV